MLKELLFAIYALKKNIQSSAELRTSFLLNVIGMAINNVTFIILWVFFVQSVGVIGGWTAVDIIGMQGFSALAFGVVFTAAMGIVKLPETVASGAFDRFMLSPKNLLLRVATSSFAAATVGDILFGLVCLVLYALIIHMTGFQVLLLVICVLLTIIVFIAMTIIIHSLSFFFVDASALTKGSFELFLTPSLFHGGAFQGAMRIIFTFAIPSLLIGALPIEAIRNVSLPTLGLIAVLAVAWFMLSIWIFNKAIKRYESSNFMTFGN
jgi:ABC-2 type transport system permease protein